MFAVLAVAVTQVVTAAPPAAEALRLDAANVQRLHGCALISAKGDAFACIEHRPSALGARSTVVFVGLDARQKERHVVYDGPTAQPDVRFARHAGLLAVNRRLARDAFSPLAPLPVATLSNGPYVEVVREDGGMFDFAGRPVRRWRASQLGPWSRCYARWTAVAGHRRGGGAGRLVIALRAAPKPGLPAGSECNDVSDDTDAAPYHYMVMAASAASPGVAQTAVPPPVPRLIGVCGRLARCVAAQRGAKLAASTIYLLVSRDDDSTRCAAVLDALHTAHAKRTTASMPEVCHAP